MVDLSGGQDGPIEHGFSNSVFIIPGIIITGLAGKFIILSIIYNISYSKYFHLMFISNII